MIRRQGLKPWLWNRDPQDWRPGATVSEITAVASRVGSGDVVLLHDWVEQPLTPAALDRSATIAALPTVIRDVRDRGLVFTTLPT